MVRQLPLCLIWVIRFRSCEKAYLYQCGESPREASIQGRPHLALGELLRGFEDHFGPCFQFHPVRWYTFSTSGWEWSRSWDCRLFLWSSRCLQSRFHVRDFDPATFKIEKDTERTHRHHLDHTSLVLLPLPWLFKRRVWFLAKTTNSGRCFECFGREETKETRWLSVLCLVE